jgi:type I restriction enzyme S subunit
MSDWKTVELCDVAKVTMGQSPSSTTYNESGIGLPFLQGCADFGSKYPIKKVYCSDPLKIVDSGSALISVRAPVGTMNIANARFCIGRGLAGIQGISVDQVFLNYLISANTFKLDTVSQGSTFLAINSDDLNHLKLSIPTSGLNQRKIATFLSTVDEVIEKTEAAIEKYKAIKAGMMLDLFTRGIDVKTGKLRPSFQDAPELYKETKLGWIPKEWEVCTIKEACLEFINGGTPSTKNVTNWVGTIPWITGADFLDTFEVGLIRRHINDEALRNSSSHLIRKGNILLVTRTGVGKLAIAPFDVAISQDITGIILDPSTYCVEFFYYYLQILVEDFKKINQGTSINGIIRSDLEATLIVKPPIEEQKHLKALDVTLKNEHRDLSKYRDLKQGLMADLLTGKVRVKINEDILENS